MNRQKVQTAINKIIEEYRETNPKAARNQYPASKKYLAQAEALGILDMIPNAPYSKEIGNTEIQLILKEAEEQVVGSTHYQGDDSTIVRSDLYKALHEDETPEPTDEDDEFPFDTSLDDLIDEVSEKEWREQLEADAIEQQAIEAAALKIEQEQYERLESVMTAAEVADTYGIANATVRQTIARGAIRARKSGSTWLILRSDAERFWNRNATKGVTTWMLTVLAVLAIVSQL